MDLEKIVRKIRNSELPEEDAIRYGKILIKEFAKEYLKEQSSKQREEPFYCYDLTVQIAEETGDEIIKCDEQCKKCKINNGKV
jgi:hypothetical protein